MSDSPVPPPPPGRKPVPPPPPPAANPAFGGPPPTKTATAPMPVLTPLATPPAPGAMAPSAANPAFGGPVPILPRPAGMPAAPMGFPAAAPSPAMTAMEQRMQDMEKRFQEQENSKKILETQLGDLQKELKAEHEKFLVQSLKVKEDENLSVRVDQQLREIQERLRREKYEQEIQDSRGKAENQLKEIERRLSQERETWMMALKNQMKEREAVEHDAEHTFGRRLREFERRYEEEKNTWAQTIRQKEEEIHQIRRDVQLEMEQNRHTLQEKDAQIDEIKDMGVQQRRALEVQAQSELRDLQSRLDNQVREAGTWKAQMALLQTQMQQSEIYRQEEKSRFEAQLQAVEKDQRSELRRQESMAETRMEELQREFSRRETERLQHWEGLVSQLRIEKESLLRQTTQREEELMHAQRDAAELRRMLDLEKSQRQAEVDQIQRMAREDAERRMPDLYADKLNVERKKYQEQAQAEIAAVKAEAARVALSEKALHAKLEVEERRAVQENEAWSQRLRDAENKRQNMQQSFTAAQQEMAQLRTLLQAETARLMQNVEQVKAQQSQEREQFEAQAAQMAGELEKIQTHWQKENKEFLNHIAQLQTEQAISQEKAGKTVITMQAHQQVLDKKIQDLMSQLNAKETDVLSKAKEAETFKKDLLTLRQQSEATSKELAGQRAIVQQLSLERVEWAQKEQEWQQNQGQMNDTLNVLRTQLVEWQTRETAWKQEKAHLETAHGDLEKKNGDLEKAVAQALEKIQSIEAAPKPTAGSPEALNALAGMRQSMSEMTQLLAWIRSGQKPAAKAA